MSDAHKGKILGPQSRAHRNAISVALVGFLRTPAQRKQATKERQARANRKLKERICNRYGRKCSNKKCRWQNEDGTFGCTDIRILQLDHVAGQGHKERSRFRGNNFYRMVLQKSVNKKKYQMLRPNCNWLKRVERKEYANT